MRDFTVIIADDELPARSKMKRMLGSFENIDILHVSENGLDALENINKLKPDIVFLDIEMPGLNGIEVAENIEPDHVPYVVFATAYNEHAIKAFELNAIDYLLKPFNEERLEETLIKISNSPRGKFLKEQRQRIQALTEGTENEGLPLSGKIPVPTHDRYLLIDFKDVVSIEVEDRQTVMYACGKTYDLSQTLDHLEKKLPSDSFLRVNRSAVIGLNHVKEIVIWFGNRFKIILDDGREVVSSREKSKILKQVLKF